jgi:hypothetical protein
MRQGDVHHVCVAVSRNGDYRIVRSLDNGQTQSVHGKMPKEELRQLTNLLEAAELRKLSGYHGGLIRQESESFAAEIPLRDGWHEDKAGNWVEHEALASAEIESRRREPISSSGVQDRRLANTFPA